MDERSSSREKRRLQREIEDLRSRLEEAEETLRAIRQGEVDSLVVSTDKGERIYTLRSADYFYRALVEQMGEGAVTINEDGVILYCNRRFAEMVALPLEQVMGEDVRSMITLRDRAHFNAMLISKTRGRKEMETALISADGTLIPVRLALSFIPHETPPSFCLVVSDMTEARKREDELREARDNLEQRVAERTADLVAKKEELEKLITERKRAEEQRRKLEAQLYRAKKMEGIGTLAGGVAHDFNNLLTTILGYAELALMQLGQGDPLYEHIIQIKNAGQKGASLTRQLLAFSRKEARRPELLDLNQAVAELEKILRRLIREDIELVINPEAGLGPVYMDPSQMDQIIMNLVVNARDAMPEGGTLTIETANVELDRAYFREHGIEESEPGSYVMLAVTDTGIGMDEETQSKIFDPFFTTKPRGTGTGLGLATVYGIVKQNRGYIWAYSEPGQGTTMKVYLPRAGEVLEPGRGGDMEVGGGLTGAETILVVEDNDQVLDMIVKILDRYGYRTLPARDGAEAVRVARDFEGEIHLLLTDVIMPGMSGKEVAERLRSERPDMKVLFMSGYTENIIMQKGILSGDIHYIQKPFSFEGLVRKVREAIDD
ncbi:hybrid sensor histidine kinase/response regulator [Methanosarcinales archaeon]|nr:response regulator [Deltaproteobacteria bacterium]MBW2123717.1 response regulator [Deltaproteobacteria bacterium]RLG23362.1 MAG: hybrid sensor histidine kinase/response regulator [Methanosarcinales archaeon]